MITVAFRVGHGNRLCVIPQATIPWGKKKAEGKSSQVNVVPDVVIYSLADSTEPVFLVDAKYKELSDIGKIGREDLYEGFVYCHATGAKKLFLAYPTVADDKIESGSIANISNYEIEDVTISAIRVVFGSITKQGDLTAFCRKLSEEILAATI